MLDQAEMMLGSFEAHAESHPDLVEQWAAEISDFPTEADGWAFAGRTTSPQEPPRPYVMVVTPLGLMFLEPADVHVVQGLSWPYFCYLDAERPTDIMHIRSSGSPVTA